MGAKLLSIMEIFRSTWTSARLDVVECTNDCGTCGLLRKDLEQHCKQVCPNQIVHCELCNKEGKHSVIVGRHKRTCPNVILELVPYIDGNFRGVKYSWFSWLKV